MMGQMDAARDTSCEPFAERTEIQTKIFHFFCVKISRGKFINLLNETVSSRSLS